MMEIVSTGLGSSVHRDATSEAVVRLRRRAGEGALRARRGPRALAVEGQQDVGVRAASTQSGVDEAHPDLAILALHDVLELAADRGQRDV